MRSGGCAAFGCLALLGVGLAGAGLVLMRGGASSTPIPVARVRPSPRPTADPDRYVDGGALREFRREERASDYQLSYGFVDYQNRAHHVTCTVSRADLVRQRDGFGYDPAEIQRLENQRLQALVDGEIARRRLAPHFTFTVTGDHYQWRTRLHGDLEAAEAERVEREAQRLSDWIEKDLDREIEKIRTELYGSRGILNRPHELVIDYARLVVDGTPALENCFRALERDGIGYTRRQYLGMLLAFFQELTYELPPDVEGRRQTLGFWVPPDVMVRGRGDCDSKSAAFASLWRHFPERLILIVLPKHVLVGVEATPGPGERSVRLGNRYYVLCEPAGPAKLHPGVGDVGGSHEYVEIQPVAPSSR